MAPDTDLQKAKRQYSKLRSQREPVRIPTYAKVITALTLFPAVLALGGFVNHAIVLASKIEPIETEMKQNTRINQHQDAELIRLDPKGYNPYNYATFP